MSQWAGGVLTAAGRALQAKVEAGTTALVLTKIKLGDGTESMDAVDNLTDLVGAKAVLGISSSVADGDHATITGVVLSTQLQAGFMCREWGLFAQDPVAGEILYMITIDNQPEWLPASTAAAQVSATYAMNIAVANATNIEVQIDPAGLVDVEMLDSYLGLSKRSHAYALGDTALLENIPAGYFLECTTAGISGATTPVITPPVTAGQTISDGTVVWTVRQAADYQTLGYRQPSTIYYQNRMVGHKKLPYGWYLRAITNGTTSSGDIAIPSSPSLFSTITDGTVQWIILNSFVAQQNVYEQYLYGLDVANVVENADTIYMPGWYKTSTSTLGLPVNNEFGILEVIGASNSFTSQGYYMQRWTVPRLNEVYVRTAFHPSATGEGWSAWDRANLGDSAIVAQSLSTNGYIKYASGLSVQWGTIGSFIPVGTAITTPTAFEENITFPITFMNAIGSVQVTMCNSNSNNRGEIYATIGSQTGFAVRGYINNKVANSSIYARWLAIGY